MNTIERNGGSSVPPADGRRDTEEPAAPADGSAAGLFHLLWSNLSDVLGTAATATLIRRAARRAARRRPALAGLTIHRNGLGYQYAAPNRWHHAGDGSGADDLRLLLRELRLLLLEMTGPVVVRRLERIPPLRRLGMTLEEQT